MITKQDYENACFSQSACNLRALVHSLASLIERNPEIPFEHPVIRLFLYQMYYLSWKQEPVSSSEGWRESYNICKEKGGV